MVSPSKKGQQMVMGASGEVLANTWLEYVKSAKGLLLSTAIVALLLLIAQVRRCADICSVDLCLLLSVLLHFSPLYVFLSAIHFDTFAVSLGPFVEACCSYFSVFGFSILYSHQLLTSFCDHVILTSMLFDFYPFLLPTVLSLVLRFTLLSSFTAEASAYDSCHSCRLPASFLCSACT
jgi:hypothetical protein